MPAVTCDKCGQKIPIPGRNHAKCNRHNNNEPTGYCQGNLRPEGQVSGGTYTPPPANTVETGYQYQ